MYEINILFDVVTNYEQTLKLSKEEFEIFKNLTYTEKEKYIKNSMSVEKADVYGSDYQLESFTSDDTE